MKYQRGARSDYKNMMSSDTRQRLVTSRYLHSSTWNFLNIFYAAGFGQSQRLEYISTKEVYGDIDRLINTVKKVEAAFYDDFGVLNEVEFSRQYLLFDERNADKKKWPINKKILYILQSYDFIQAITIQINAQATYENIEKKLNIKGLSIPEALIAEKHISIEKIQEAVGSSILNYIHDNFNSNGLNKTGYQNKILGSLGISNENLPKGALSSGKSKYLEEALRNAMVFDQQAIEAMLQKFIQYYSKKAEDLDIKEPDYTIYLNKILNGLREELQKGIKSSAFFVQSRQVGFVGEWGIEITTNFAKVIGDKIEERTIVQNGKEKSFGALSKSDLVFTGLKTGTEYRIQAKNSFQELFNSVDPTKKRYYAARFQNSMALPTLLNTLVSRSVSSGGISRDTANEIAYALMNFEFLSKYDAHNNNINKNQYQGVRSMISRLLNTAIMYYLGISITDNLPETFEGNLFIILANKYLVPFSYFLESMRDSLKYDFNYEKLRDIGVTAQRPATNININTSGVDPLELYEEKQKLISGEDFPQNQYFYPDSLIQIGKAAGDTIYANTKISGIHLLFNVTKLRERFESRIK